MLLFIWMSYFQPNKEIRSHQMGILLLLLMPNINLYLSSVLIPPYHLCFLGYLKIFYFLFHVKLFSSNYIFNIIQTCQSLTNEKEFIALYLILATALGFLGRPKLKNCVIFLCFPSSLTLTSCFHLG